MFCCCFLWMQGRCSRENCKYLHPPSHLKTQLEINGRNNLIQQKTAAAVLAQQMQLMIPGPSMQPVVRSLKWLSNNFSYFWLKSDTGPFPSFSTSAVQQGLGTNPSLGYGSYFTPLNHGMSLIPSDILSSTPVLVPGSSAVTVQCSSSSSSSSSSSPSQKLARADRLEVSKLQQVWFNFKTHYFWGS